MPGRESHVSAPKWFEFGYPDEFKLELAELADRCGWHLQRSGSAVRACLHENYEATAANLVRIRHIADAATAGEESSYRHLDLWPRSDRYKNPLIDHRPELQKALTPTTFAEWWSAWQLRILTASDEDFPKVVRSDFLQIAERHPDASLWAFEIDERLMWRVATVRALFAAQQQPDVVRDADFRGFPPGIGLMRSLSFTLDVFLNPFLAIASPWTLGVAAPRLGGMVVVLFGQPIPAFIDSQAPELLRLYRATGPIAARDTSRDQPRLDQGQIRRGITWWVHRLDELMRQALDPARHCDETGVLEPARHMGTLLSLERLFASTLQLLADWRDDYDRLNLTFDIADLLDGLGVRPWEKIFSLQALGGLRAELADWPDPMPALLEPLVDRAANALRSIQAGFAQPALRDGKLSVPTRSGHREGITLDHATARYLRLARNSTHSFRTMAKDARDMAILSAHMGEVDPELPDVAVLEVVRFLRHGTIAG